MSPETSTAPTATRVPITLGRGIAVAVLYAAVFLAAGLVSGVDYDDISQSTSNVVGFVVIPVGLGILVTLAVTARWGWWHQLFHEENRITQPRWRWLIPAFVSGTILVTLIVAPWDEFPVGLVLLILVGTLMVGFAEEIIFRGYLLLGARAHYSEVGAWFFSSVAFGLLHGLNIISGQAVGLTIKQIILAFVLGSGFYLIRRITGLLVVCMLLHGLWDFSTFIGAGRGDHAEGIAAGLAAAPFVYGAAITTIAVLFITFRKHGGTSDTTPAVT